MKTRWAAPTRTTWWALGIAFATTVATATYLASVYGTLPIGVPVRYIRGLPALYQLKSPMLVGLPALIQVGLLLLLGAVIMLLLWRARATVAGSDPSADADSMRMRLAAEGIALLAAVWIGVQALGAARLITLWRAGSGGFGRVYSLAMVAAIVVSIAIAFRTMKLVGGSQRRSAAADDPSVWWLRSLYFNPRDPALFVATRRGVGWTLNFGRPMAIVLLLVILILGISGPYYVARYVLLAFSNDFME